MSAETNKTELASWNRERTTEQLFKFIMRREAEICETNE